MISLYCVVGEDERDSGSSGFLSLVFLTRFFRSALYFLPVFDAYSGLGHFQSFRARCSWDRSFRRAPPRPPA